MSVKPRTQRSARKKIFIVDDHPMMREGLAQLIAQESDLMVCGEADDAAEAISKIEKLRPDLALVDITLRPTNGLELIKDFRFRSRPFVERSVMSTSARSGLNFSILLIASAASSASPQTIRSLSCAINCARPSRIIG